jgi:hypothetical protein
MATRKTFITDCISSDGESINAMKDGSVDISRSTFVRHTDNESRQDIERSLGYGKDFSITKDWHVGYSKGTYRGKPCVYMTWSAIEYIFV